MRGGLVQGGGSSTSSETDLSGLLELKGSTNASTNPNYPAASKGDAYVVTVAGKVGGSGGKAVEVGDVYFATADNAGGTEASVGTSWTAVERNLAVDGSTLEFSGTTLRVKDGGITRAKLETVLKDDWVTVELFAPDVAVATGDGRALLPVPPAWDGLKLKAIRLYATGDMSSSGAPSVQVYNLTQTRDLLTTNVTVDANERSSATAATPAVIDTSSSHDVLTDADLLRFDVDAAGTAAKGLTVQIKVGP